jgi:hypothetical protein
MAAVAMSGAPPLPHFATRIRPQADPGDGNSPVESGMAIHFADASKICAPLLPHGMQIIASL